MLPDSAIVAAAESDPSDERTLLGIPGFGGRSVRRLAKVWLDALAEARVIERVQASVDEAADEASDGPATP